MARQKTGEIKEIKNRDTRGWLLIVNVLLTIFMLAPILIIVLTSFTPTSQYKIPTTQWSLQWYAQILTRPAYIKGFGFSMVLALVAAIISTLVGFMASFALCRYEFKGKKIVDSLFFAPLSIPGVVIGNALIIYYSKMGLYDTFFSFLMAHVIITVPYVIKTISTSIVAVSKDMELAALNLGASYFTTFRKVTIPLIRTGIVGAFIYAYLVSFGEVTIAIFISGSKYVSLPLLMYNYMQDLNTPMIAAISTLLILYALILMVIVNKVVGLKKLFA